MQNSHYALFEVNIGTEIMSFLNILEKSDIGRNKTNGIDVVTKPDVVIR